LYVIHQLFKLLKAALAGAVFSDQEKIYFIRTLNRKACHLKK